MNLSNIIFTSLTQVLGVSRQHESQGKGCSWQNDKTRQEMAFVLPFILLSCPTSLMTATLISYVLKVLLQSPVT